MAWWEQIKANSRVEVPVEKLSFDIDNPRFTPEKRPESDSDVAIISHLFDTADLSELVQSISASGYIDIEPLIVEGRGDKLVVIEGNRRLAAVKVLKDPALAAAARVSLPKIDDDKRATLDKLAVYRVTDEAQARDLIGFKHINGPQGWDAYAKARYAAKWLDIEREKRERGQTGLTAVEIAHRMGDKHDTIYRIVTAAYVLEQAQDLGVFRVEDRARKNFSFSHLYTALTYPEFRDFIGMEASNRSQDPVRDPVPPARASDLRQLLLWLYGSRSEGLEPAVKKQNPDLARLKRVLGDPRSRRVMLERGNLDEAVESTVTPSERFEKSLVDAEQSLKNALSALDGYDPSDATLLEIGRSALTKARVIVSTMDVAHAEAIKDAGASDFGGQRGD
jgi:hypothetical protein